MKKKFCPASALTMGPEKLKKSRPKKLVKSNKLIFWGKLYFLVGFKLFPSAKIDFWLFLKLQKMEFHEIDLFDITSYFGKDFFKYSSPLCEGMYM